MLRRKRNARRKMKTIDAWVRYITLFLFSILFLLISGCENTRHSIGVSGKPLSTDMEQNIKMNYKIIFGKVRPKEDTDE
jgi:hypothetical protein